MEQLQRADEVQAADEQFALAADEQHGLITRSQVVELGGTRSMILHRIETGRWEHLSADVFRIVGSPKSWRQEVLAATLAWGSGSAASHRAAAPLIPLVGFEPIELTVPRSRKRSNAPGIIHRHAIFPGDIRTVDAIPVTTPARTLIDLASVVSEDLVEEALDDALRRRIVALDYLRRRLTIIGRPGRPGIGTIRRLLDARDPSAAIPESVFERRMLRTLRDGGLPAPVAQHKIMVHGRLIARVDLAYPEVRLAIEADGYRWHSSRNRWDRDRTRDNRLMLLGWRIIRVTWTELTRHPESLVAAVRTALTGQI